jgi:ribonuclease P/MRP protein subunit RPP1
MLTLGKRITFLGLAQNVAHDAATTTPKSLVFRARACFSLFSLRAPARRLQPRGFSETRRTYRAVFSEPKVIIPDTPAVRQSAASGSVETKPSGERQPEVISVAAVAPPVSVTAETRRETDGQQRKRPRNSVEPDGGSTTESAQKKRKGKKSG